MQQCLTSLSGARSRASSSLLFLRLGSAPSLSSKMATSPARQRRRDVSRAGGGIWDSARRTVALGYGVVQRRVALVVCWIQRAAVREQQANHGRGAGGGGAVHGVLAAAVVNPSRGRGLGVGDEQTGHVQILFGGHEVKRGLVTGCARF